MDGRLASQLRDNVSTDGSGKYLDRLRRCSTGIDNGAPSVGRVAVAANNSSPTVKTGRQTNAVTSVTPPSRLPLSLSSGANYSSSGEHSPFQCHLGPDLRKWIMMALEGHKKESRLFILLAVVVSTRNASDEMSIRLYNALNFCAGENLQSGSTAERNGLLRISRLP